MCNHIFKRFPCGTTVHQDVEWQHCDVFRANPRHGPCIKDQPSYSVTFAPATASDSSYTPTSDSDSDAEFLTPIRCHAAHCRSCNTDLTSYRRAISAFNRQRKHGPDWLTDWYGHGDPSADPNFPEYQEWLEKLRRIAIMEELDEADDEDRFWILNPNETWRGGESGWKTKDGEPIEKVDRLFQWAAKDILREKERARKREEREEARRVQKEKEMEEKKRAEEMNAMEGVEETKVHLESAQNHKIGGESGEGKEDKWEKDMALSIDSLASLSL